MKTLILWADALRKSYITQENMPFLYKLSKRHGLVSIKPSFGFSQASWFTGLYPNKHGEFSTFKNGKDKIKTKLLKLLPNKLRPFAFNLIRYLKGNDYISHFIDVNKMGSFSLTREKYYHHDTKIKTLFDYFKENNVSYMIYYWPLIIENGKTRLTPFTKGSDLAKTKKSIKLIRKTNHEVYFFHLSELDGFGHSYGPDSNQIKVKLREQDWLIERLVREFDPDKTNILIWSDHGMLSIKGLIDLESLPKDKRYLALIESTMAKFWFNDEEIKEEILTRLKKIKHGHVLSKAEQKKFNIDFKDNENYEEIFLADPGYLIMPNVFQSKPIKGAHGYDYSNKNELAVLITNRQIVRKQGNMVDMLPTILNLLKIKQDSVDGSSLI